MKRYFAKLWSPLMHLLHQRQFYANNASWLLVVLGLVKILEFGHLERAYRLLAGGAKDPLEWRTKNAAVFWDLYWCVARAYQPWLIHCFHRTIGLNPEDPCFKNPSTSNCLWCQEDPLENKVPCTLLWSWHKAVYGESITKWNLLASYPFDTLIKEINERVNEPLSDPWVDNHYVFGVMLMCMLCRMHMSNLFMLEHEQWRNEFAAWSTASRRHLLRWLQIGINTQTSDYTYKWAPDLFPEAIDMLDVARATGDHPAKVIEAWYEQREQGPAQTLPIVGIFD